MGKKQNTIKNREEKGIKNKDDYIYWEAISWKRILQTRSAKEQAIIIELTVQL